MPRDATLFPPVIVVPGIKGSTLLDEYEVPFKDVWSAPKDLWRAVINRGRKRYERIAMHPHDPRYEAREPARVRAGSMFEIIYEDLIEELREELSERSGDRTVPVYPFGYDWRMPLAETERHLSDFVHEVIDRTKLLLHYDEVGYGSQPKVSLVGHSMGGLIIAGYLESCGGELVNKVVTVGSPFQGSCEAVEKIITGKGANSGSSRERKAARMTPALYHLLPSFEDAFTIQGQEVASDSVPSIYDPDLWQPSVIESIDAFVGKWGLPGRLSAREVFDGLLKEGKRHRERIGGLSLEAVGMDRKDWLAVAGIGAETLVGFEIEYRDGKLQFRLTDHKNEGRNTGDGTVPLAGALPLFLEEKHLVCVAPKDFGRWIPELSDNALRRFAGFHAALPEMNMLHDLIVRFFTDGDNRYPNTWGRPVPGVANDEWDPPLDLDPADERD